MTATYREAEPREVRHRESERSSARSDGDRVSLMNRDNDQPVERRQNKDNGRHNRSSLIETSHSTPPTTELQQNIEPYDVLFLTKTQQKPAPASLNSSLVSTTPDVALPGHKQQQVAVKFDEIKNIFPYAKNIFVKIFCSGSVSAAPAPAC